MTDYVPEGLPPDVSDIDRLLEEVVALEEMGARMIHHATALVKEVKRLRTAHCKAVRSDELAPEDLVYRLKKRAKIRRNATTRKSVQEGAPDRISDLLEEAAKEIERLREGSKSREYSKLSKEPFGDGPCNCGDEECPGCYPS